MTTQLARRELTPEFIAMAESLAPRIHGSRLFNVSSPEQAVAIMLKGHELGLGMTAAFELIHIIQGQASISPRGALALIHQSGLLTGLEIDNQPDACTVMMTRRGGISYTCTFTMQDALRAELVKPGGNWIKYPANMMRWRAIGYCADVMFPDVLAGMKTADQFGAAIDEAGDVVTLEVQDG